MTVMNFVMSAVLCLFVRLMKMMIFICCKILLICQTRDLATGVFIRSIFNALAKRYLRTLLGII